MADYEKVFEIKFATDKALRAVEKLESQVSKISVTSAKVEAAFKAAEDRMANAVRVANEKMVASNLKKEAAFVAAENRMANAVRIANEKKAAAVRKATLAEEAFKNETYRISQALDRHLNQKLIFTSANFERLGLKIASVGRTMTTHLSLPIGVLTGMAIKFASDYNESLNNVQVSFGGASKVVEDFAKTTLKSFGIAEGTALDMASGFGDMATSMGINRDAAAKMSTQIVGLAGDLASFKNLSMGEVQVSLTGIFTGETESLKRLGVVMTEENLKLFAREQGITKNYKSMSQAEKVMLRFKYVTEMTKNAHGDFARTADGAANSTRTLSESYKEMSQKLGKELLPIYTAIVNKVTKLIQWFGSLSENQKEWIVTIGLVVAALGPLLWTFGKIITVAKALRTALIALNVVSWLNPVGIVIALIGAAIVETALHWNELVASFEIGITKIEMMLIDLKSTIDEIFSGSKFLEFVIGKLPEADKAILDKESVERRRETTRKLMEAEDRLGQIDVDAARSKDKANLDKIFGFFKSPLPEFTPAIEKPTAPTDEISQRPFGGRKATPYYIDTRTREKRAAEMSARVQGRLSSLQSSPIDVAIGPTTITVNGATSPIETARVINRELDKRDRKRAKEIGQRARGISSAEQ